MQLATIRGIISTALFAASICPGANVYAAAHPQSDDVSTIAAYVTDHPLDPEARCRLAVSLSVSGFQSLAAEQLDAAERIKPGYVLTTFHRMIDEDKTGAANALIFYTSRKYPDDPGVLLLTANTLALHGHQDMSASLLKKLVTLAPRQKGLHVAQARIKASQHQWLATKSLAQKELSLYPESLPAKIELARALTQLQQSPDQIASYLQEAFLKTPSDVDANLIYARFLVDRRRYREAVAPLLRNIAIGSRPEHVKPTDGLMAQVLQHVPAQTVKLQADDFDATLPTDFRKGFFHFRLGNAFNCAKRPEQANEEYMEAIESHPYFAGTASFLLARNLDERLQKPELALSYYQRALDLKPYDTQLRRSIARAISRMQNRRRDIAWQLKTALWHNVDKTR